MKTLKEYKEMVAPYVCDVSEFLSTKLWQNGKEILLEGQLGALKDPDHGIYPMVTSSSTLAAYGAIGAGVPPYDDQRYHHCRKSLLQCCRRRCIRQRDPR